MTSPTANDRYPHAEAMIERKPGEVKTVREKQTNLQQRLSKQTTKKKMKGPEYAFGAQGCLQVKQKENASQSHE